MQAKNRVCLGLVAGWLAATLLGCDSAAPTPAGVPATLTAQAADNATAVVAQQLALTYVAATNATATVALTDFARLKPLIQVTLQPGPPVLLAGIQRTGLTVTVANRDQAAHHVVIRLYDRQAPLNTEGYSIAALDVPAGGSASTPANSARPFAVLAAQVQQIDALQDYRPPVP
ncbi:MAG TPA: hypothetical protein VKY74_02770 [Chloroflexia bacterium]|nr:hypothetical protein [Chloroflexia bacterium]